MQLPENPATKDIIVQGTKITCPLPFVAGHPLTDIEAGVLNQTFLENIRNNTATTVAKMNENDEGEGIQSYIDGYVDDYEFGVRRGGYGGLDPVEKEARDLAKERVKKALLQKGFKLRDVTAEQMNGFIDKVLEKYPDIYEVAKNRVEEKKRIGAQELELDI